MMIQSGIDVDVAQVACGDYIIDRRLTIERKTAKDFLVSIIDGRLFKQAARLKTNARLPILLIEGNPFKTDLNVSRPAIKGALLCIQAVFYLPVVFSRSREESVDLMKGMADLIENHTTVTRQRGGYRPRKLASRQLYFLQGLPGIGPQLARRLMECFGTVSKIFTVPVEKLKQVPGIGPVTAGKINDVLHAPWKPQ